MLTTQQVAERANIHANTVRKYSSQYAVLLSHHARGEDGARLFTDADVDTLCAIAALRRTGMHASAIVEQLGEDAAPTVIDVAPTEATQSPHAANIEATQATIAPRVPHEFYVDILARLERVERNQQHTIDDAFYRGRNRGLALAGGICAVIIWLIALLSYSPWWWWPW